MYYQVLVSVKEGDQFRDFYELDKTDLDEIKRDVVTPYLRGHEFQFDGFFIKSADVRRLVIKTTTHDTETLSDQENAAISSGVIMYISRQDIVSYDKLTTDITKEVFQDVRATIDEPAIHVTPLKHHTDSVFIVHGHDVGARTQVARFLEKLGIRPIVLQEQVSSGQTIIEKIESHSDVGFGVVLYNPDDEGRLVAGEDSTRPRARQNVVFEHGFLVSKLGRARVCALVEDGVETPNDVSGVVYVLFDNQGAWRIKLSQELKAAGYDIDLNKVLEA